MPSRLLNESTLHAEESFLRKLRVAVLAIAVVVLLSFSMLRSIPIYQPLWLQLLAFAILAVVGLVETTLLLLRRTWGWFRWPALLAVLGASVASLASLPADYVTSSADWAFGAVGWFGLILLLDQPIALLIGFLTVHESIEVAAVLFPGSVDSAVLLNLAAGSLGTIGYPLACGVAATALRRVARTADTATRAASGIRTADAVAAQLHENRERRFADLHDTAIPLLQGLADGVLRLDDPQVRRACKIEAARMRRLFAEVDEIDHSRLLHELRHCVAVADKRNVIVDMDTRGEWPEPPLAIRRALTDGPLAALATATSWARVTVIGTPGVVSVSVVADCGSIDLPDASDTLVQVTTAEDQQIFWVEARWTTV